MHEESIADLSQQRKLLRERGICVVIPTFNNAGTIADVVKRAMQQCDDVIVVCDGCTDGTFHILSEMELAVRIVELKHNSGKGAALKAGFSYALKAGFSYAITLDGDGQHFPEDIPTLLESNIEHPGALIVGSRKGLKEAQRSRGSRFANGFSNFWFAVQTGHFLKDTQTGYRLYPLKKLHLLSLLTSRYEAELELLVFSSWNGVKLVSEDVNVYYPPKDERVSHFRPGRDFLRISILNVVLCLLAIVYGYPRRLLHFLLEVLRTLLVLFVFFTMTMFVATPITFFYTLKGGDTERKKRNIHIAIQKSTAWVLNHQLLPGVRYTLRNPHNETFKRPAIVICNHQSHLDLLPLLAISDKLAVMTKGWVTKDPFYGFIIRKAEFLPVSDGVENIMPKVESLIERGYSIAIYPEGTRSLDFHMGRFHKGAFHLATQLDLDIVPLVLYGASFILPKHGKIMHSWPMSIDIEPRISPQQLSLMGDTARQQASAVREYYQKRYSEIANMVERDV